MNEPLHSAVAIFGNPTAAIAGPAKTPLRCLHHDAYNAGIMGKQYTIRSVPAAVDRALRRRAKQEAKSLNTVVVEAIARGLELDVHQTEHKDLDSLIGSWQEDPDFDRAVADFEQIDEQAWK